MTQDATAMEELMNEYIARLESRCDALEEALRDCVNVMEGQVMQLGDRKEHHVLYDEWKAGKELLEEG